MGKAVVEIVGIDSFLKRIDGVKAGKDRVYKAVTTAVAKVAATAKNLCPVDTGNLRNSIHMDVKSDDDIVVGRVSNDAEYAMYVEFGTGVRGQQSNYPTASKIGLAYDQKWQGQKAQPFLYPALKQNEQFIKSTIAASMGGSNA